MEFKRLSTCWLHNGHVYWYPAARKLRLLSTNKLSYDNITIKDVLDTLFHRSSLSNFLTFIKIYMKVALLNVLSMCTCMCLDSLHMSSFCNFFYQLCPSFRSTNYNTTGGLLSRITVFFWGLESHGLFQRLKLRSFFAHVCPTDGPGWSLLQSYQTNKNKLHKLCGRHVNISQILPRFQIPKKRTINLIR